jgi:hypothetical protein
MRKTKKYYRELLENTKTISQLKPILFEIVKKYGKNGQLYLKGEYSWNFRLTGFYIPVRSKTLYVEYYWQGDDTDGDDCIEFDNFINKSTVIIPAETYFDGRRTYYKHGDIEIDRKDIFNLIPKLIELLKVTRKKVEKS